MDLFYLVLQIRLNQRVQPPRSASEKAAFHVRWQSEPAYRYARLSRSHASGYHSHFALNEANKHGILYSYGTVTKANVTQSLREIISMYFIEVCFGIIPK